MKFKILAYMEEHKQVGRVVGFWPETKHPQATCSLPSTSVD